MRDDCSSATTINYMMTVDAWLSDWQRFMVEQLGWAEEIAAKNWVFRRKACHKPELKPKQHMLRVRRAKTTKMAATGG